MTKFDLYFDDDNKKFVAMNPETGEIVDIMPEKKKAKKTSSKKDENPNPEIVLEANKYVLNTAAVELLGVEPDDKIEIKIIHGDPVIGKNSAFGLEGGNRFTKSNSVSYRGKNNEQLSKFGNIFSLEATDKEGQFRMVGNTPKLPTETEEIANVDEIDDIDDLVISDEQEEVSKFKFTI